MILHSIGLAGWRCFVERVDVGPLSEKLNVIFGPNATGKTTLFEALRRALMDSYAVTGQEINELRPWGRALSPKVMVVFSHGGSEYRVTKQFTEGGFTKLDRKENGDFRAFAENRQADDFIRGLLSKDAPGRGLSQSKHWGLAHVLWAPQGELKLADLSGDLISDIHVNLGVQLSDRASGPIEEKVQEQYLQFFTAQGKVKSGKAAPPIAQMDEALDAARQKRTRAFEALTQAEDASRRVEDLGIQYRQKTIEADELAKSILKARDQADRFRALKQDEAIKKSNYEKLDAEHSQQARLISDIDGTGKELADQRSIVDQLDADLPIKKKEADEEDSRLRYAKEDLGEVRKGKENVALAEKAAEDARIYLENKKASEDLGRRIRKIEIAEKALSELKIQRASLVAPDTRTIKRFRSIFQERDRAKALMDSAMLRLEIAPEVASDIEIIKGDRPRKVHLSPGSPSIIKGSPAIEAVIKGFAKLNITGPAGDVDSYRKTFECAQGQLEELARPYGMNMLEELEELAEKASSLDKKIGEAEKGLAVLYEDSDRLTLVNERVSAVAVIDDLEKKHPQWKVKPPDNEILRRKALDLKRAQSFAERDAESKWEAAEKRASFSREQVNELSRKQIETNKSLKKLELYLGEVTKDGKTKEGRANELRSLLLGREAAKEAVADLREKLSGFAGDPQETLDKLEKNQDVLRKIVQKIRDDERTAMGNLEILVAGGPYSVLARADEDISRLQEEMANERIKMDSAQLLYETIRECRAEALAAVARPVEDVATRLVNRIGGRRLGRICINEGFVPSGVSPEMAEAAVGLDCLSGGEQEQLYFATRLALAEVLAKDERQMVVFDDVLTATDTSRFARILTILEEASEKLQIIILTCHPERYGALDKAKRFDIESLISQRIQELG